MPHAWTTTALFATMTLFLPFAAFAWESESVEPSLLEYHALAQGGPDGGRRMEWREKMRAMPPEERERFREERREHMDEMRETVHLWRLHQMRETLELTDEQFLKVMKIEEARTKREREIGDHFEGTLPKLREALETNASDKEIQMLLDTLARARDERRRAEDAYETDMRGVLSPRQQAKFLIFQRQFERRVREIIMERRMEHAGAPGEAPHSPRPPKPRR